MDSNFVTSFASCCHHRRLLASGPFSAGFLLLRLGRFDVSRSGDDPCHPFFANPALGLCGFRRGGRWWLRLSPNLCPSALLSFFHPATSRSGEFAAFPSWCRWCGGILAWATWKHGTKFGNLIVNPALLRLEAFNGGGDDGCGELECRHVSLS
jgi:hypothetical protein